MKKERKAKGKLVFLCFYDMKAHFLIGQHWFIFPSKSLQKHDFFCNFVRILSFSLSKGSLGDWGKMGLRFGNRTQFHILLWNAFNEHPMLSHQPYYGSSSGAKVTISFEKAKSIHIFFFRACSSLLNWLRHLLWHLPEKCVLGYVLLP